MTNIHVNLFGFEFWAPTTPFFDTLHQVVPSFTDTISAIWGFLCQFIAVLVTPFKDMQFFNNGGDKYFLVKSFLYSGDGSPWLCQVHQSMGSLLVFDFPNPLYYLIENFKLLLLGDFSLLVYIVLFIVTIYLVRLIVKAFV